MQRLQSIFKDCKLHPLTDPDSDNIFAEGQGGVDVSLETEDVSIDTTLGIATGETTHSRLAWGDFIRNVRIFAELSHVEPNVVLEVGCGNNHPVGSMIVKGSLSTHYIGLDVTAERAAKVVAERGNKKQFVGLWHDASLGLPLVDSSVDHVLCLEAMEHFVKTENEMLEFFNEVHRVLTFGGRFTLATPNPQDGVLIHPNCHDHEFSMASVKKAIDDAGMIVTNSYAYRAKGNIVSQLVKQHKGHYLGLPDAAIEALTLPGKTAGKDVRGNIVYEITL